MSDFKGVWIPAKVWECKELTLLEKHFLAKIHGLDNGKGCNAGNTFLAEFFFVSNSRCTQVVKKLESKKFIKITLIREKKEIVNRVINVLKKGIELFKQPIEETKQGIYETKQGIEEIKQGYLENSEYSNTENKNKEEELKEGKDTPPHENDIPKTFPMWYLELEQAQSFQKLSEKLQIAFKDFLMYRNRKEKRGIVIDTAIQNLKKLHLFLTSHSEDKIIASFDLCKEAGNVTFDPNFVDNRAEKLDKDKPKGFAYDLPNFQTAKQREWWFFQKFEFYKTLEILENRLINTTYYKLAYEKRQPEKLIQQLETEFPNLLDHPFKNDRWQNIQ